MAAILSLCQDSPSFNNWYMRGTSSDYIIWICLNKVSNRVKRVWIYECQSILCRGVTKENINQCNKNNLDITIDVAPYEAQCKKKKKFMSLTLNNWDKHDLMMIIIMHYYSKY